jgi:uncharacterized protein YraI
MPQTTGGEMPRVRTAARRSMRLPAALLLIGMGAALGGCGEAATAKVEVPLRTAPENDREIVVLIPQGSAVKISKCAHGWCQVSWHGQKGYALAKNFIVAGLERGTTHADFDADQSDQDNDGSDD